LIILFTQNVAAARLQCFDLFKFEPRTTVIRSPDVFKVETADGAFVFKVYTGAESRILVLEQQALLLLADLVQKTDAVFLKATENPRVTSRNEHFLKDEVWGQLMWQSGGLTAAPLKKPDMKMLVTRFEDGRYVEDIFNDPNITIAAKQKILDDFWRDVDGILTWLASHPEYRHLGLKVTAKEVGGGDWYEFPAKDGDFVFEYRSVEISTGRYRVVVDGFSNLVLNPQGRVVLFDPL